MVCLMCVSGKSFDTRKKAVKDTKRRAENVNRSNNCLSTVAVDKHHVDDVFTEERVTELATANAALKNKVESISTNVSLIVPFTVPSNRTCLAEFWTFTYTEQQNLDMLSTCSGRKHGHLDVIQNAGRSTSRHYKSNHLCVLWRIKIQQLTVKCQNRIMQYCRRLTENVIITFI